MANPTSLFADLPLNTNERQLRLWSFENTDASHSSRSLQLNLRVHSKEDGPVNYIALSYVWGSLRQSPETIYVNGCKLAITANLRDLLRLLQARYLGTKQLFWADQISLDQRNIQERDHQVALMGDIFSQASRVIAWLGPMPSVERHDLPCWFTRDWHVESETSMRSEARRTTTEHHDLRHAVVAHDLFTREYWSRLWIVQEVVLAKDLLICCGNLCFGRRELRDILEWMPVSGIYRGDPDYCADLVSRADLLAFSIPRTLRVTMRTLLGTLPKQKHILPIILDFTRERHCSDPRDKIYGLQALVVERQRVVVDYSKPLARVVDDALRTIMMYLQARAIDRETENLLDRLRKRPSAFDHILGDIDPQWSTRRADHLWWALYVSRIPHFISTLRTCATLDHLLSWSAVWTLGRTLARTSRQIQLSDEMKIAAEHSENVALWRVRLDHAKDFGGIELQTIRDEIWVEMLVRARRIVSEMAARHDFSMYGEFLSHSDDWPFPEDQPSGVVEYLNQ